MRTPAVEAPAVVREPLRPPDAAAPSPRPTQRPAADRDDAGDWPAATAAAAPSGGYVLEVALGGGRAIRLGGIAWSEAAPLAYLNGRLIGVGEYVEGYRVVAIERDRVRFDGGDEAAGVRFDVRLR